MDWRNLAGSATAHVALLSALFLAFPFTRHRPISSALEVNLVQLPAGPESAPAPPPEPTAPKPELVPEKTPNRPKDEVVKIPKKGEEKPKPTRSAEPPTTTGSAAVGAPGLAADVGVDEADFEFTYYLIALRNRIAQNWSAPAGLSPSGQPVRSVIHFRIGRDGKVSEAVIEERSGIAFFDQSALRAVIVSDPVPPLPLGFAGASLGVHFAFEYSR